MTTKECGAFIAELRKQKNLTQKQLAEKLNVSDKAISRWETGKGYPDVSSLVALSEFFSVSVNELLAGDRIEKAALSEVAEKNVIDAIASKEKSDKKKNVALIVVSIAFTVLLLLRRKRILRFTTPAPGCRIGLYLMCCKTETDLYGWRHGMD